MCIVLHIILYPQHDTVKHDIIRYGKFLYNFVQMTYCYNFTSSIFDVISTFQ